MAASIRTHNLTKHYGRSAMAALDGLSIAVQPGEVYGFLGANGAGKSTTIRLLLNFLQPTSGTATILGHDVVRESEQARHAVGYLAGDVALYTKPTGSELLDYLSALQGGNHRSYRRQLETRFEADLHKPIGSLSKGNRQKIGIIQAFMHQPDVLILDEPTSGLDPLMQEAFYETVRESRERGAAILMSSHNLDEAQRICDRVGIIKHGKLIREQTVGDTDLSLLTFRVRFKSAAEVTRLQKDKTFKLIKQLNDREVEVQPIDTIAQALHVLGTYDIQQFETRQNSLEDEFLEFYGSDET